MVFVPYIEPLLTFNPQKTPRLRGVFCLSITSKRCNLIYVIILYHKFNYLASLVDPTGIEPAYSDFVDQVVQPATGPTELQYIK